MPLKVVINIACTFFPLMAFFTQTFQLHEQFECSYMDLNLYNSSGVFLQNYCCWIHPGTDIQTCMQTYFILSGLHRTGMVLAFEIWKGMQRGSLRVRHTTVKFEPDDPAVYFIKLVWVNRVIELQSRNMWFCWPFLSISICQGGFSQSVPLVACTMKPSNLPSDVCLRWPLALTSEVSSFLTHWEGLNINMTRVHQCLNINSKLNVQKG